MGSIRRAPRTSRWEARFRDSLRGQPTETFDSQSFLANVAPLPTAPRSKW